MIWEILKKEPETNIYDYEYLSAYMIESETYLSDKK